MSKYNLVELLTELKGGRTGTYLATLDELEEVVKMLESYEEIRGVKQLGISGDGKTQFEYIILPSDGDAFSIYPYKFDPERETGKLPFSIAGDIEQAKKYIKLMDADADVFTNMEYKAFVPQMKDMEENKIEEDVESILAKQETTADDIKKEIRFHLDQYRSGAIDGDDLAQAIEEIVFGEVKAPGMFIDDEEWEQEMGRGMEEEVTEEKIEIEEEEMISKDKYDKLLDNAASRYEELENQFIKFIQDKYDKDFDMEDFKDFQGQISDEASLEESDKVLKEHFGRFLKDYQ